jgi:hypothetical protein
MSRHVDVVCAKVQVHVYGGVTTVFIVLQIVVRAHDFSSWFVVQCRLTADWFRICEEVPKSICL